MEALTKGLLAVVGVVGVTGVLAIRSRRAQAAENAARGSGDADTTQTRPLPASLDAMTPEARSHAIDVAQWQASALGSVINDTRGEIGADTRAAFDRWRAAHPTTRPGDIGVIVSMDDVYRAGHGMPAVTSAPLGR